jgi:hypothetical protein
MSKRASQIQAPTTTADITKSRSFTVSFGAAVPDAFRKSLAPKLMPGRMPKILGPVKKKRMFIAP